MRDTVRHIVVDTSVLAAAFVPACTDSEAVRVVIAGVFAASSAAWPAMRLYVPAICVAETLGVFDKLRFKEDRLSPRDHELACAGLQRFVTEKHYHQFEQHPKHVLATGLVSPLNYSIRGAPGRAMGAADCLVAGMAVLLAQQVGVNDVVLLTADAHMAAVMSEARRMNADDAARMGLVDAAARVGVGPWCNSLYPRCLNVREATPDQLRDSFLGWPLPSDRCRAASALRADDKAAIWSLYQSVRSEYGFRGREKLLSSPALDDLRTRLACQRRLCMTAADLYWAIADLEKNPKRRHRLFRSSAIQTTDTTLTTRE